MRAAPEIYEAFAGLMSYPAGLRRRIADEWAPAVADEVPGIRAELEPLLGDRVLPEPELEELYARTFDNSAERALEVGWHLYGENYARGEFMIRMRNLIRECGLVEGTELPDHLSNVLAVMARSTASLEGALASQILLPAIRKMLHGFEADENARNPYGGVLDGLKQFLEARESEDRNDE